MILQIAMYPLANQHSYWKWPCIVSCPIKNGDFCNKLRKGTTPKTVGRSLKSLSPAASSVSRNTRPLIPRDTEATKCHRRIRSAFFLHLKNLMVLDGSWWFLMVLDGSRQAKKCIFILESSDFWTQQFYASPIHPSTPFSWQGTVQDGLAEA